MGRRRRPGRIAARWAAARRHAAVLVVLGLAAALPLVPPRPVAAQEKQLAPAVVAVIDYQRILREARAARAIRDQVESRRQLYQDEIAREEQRLHEADKELARQRSVLSAEAFSEQRREFEGEVAQVQRMVQERRRQLDQVAASALNEVRSAMIEVVGELSDVRGFNLVLPTSGLLLFSPKIDLTDEVLAQLDRKLPNVKVPERVE
jgi:outer membrane protein